MNKEGGLPFRLRGLPLGDESLLNKLATMLMIAAAKLIIAVAKLIFLYLFSCFHLLSYIYNITYMGCHVK